MRWKSTARSTPPSPLQKGTEVLRASFLYLSHRRGLQQFVTRQRLTASLAYRFVAGGHLDDAVRVVSEVNRRGWSAGPHPPGESLSEEKGARAAPHDYLAAVGRIRAGRVEAQR